MTVRIHGRSIAGLVCQTCLAQQGVEATMLDRPRPAPAAPVLVINGFCLDLLAEICPDVAWRSLGVGLQERHVLWGDDPQVRRIADDSRVVAPDRLAAALAAGNSDVATRPEPTAGAWEVNADRPPAATIAAGRRVLVTAETELVRPLDPPRTLMESQQGGWLFLAPTGPHRAVVQAMTPAAPDDPAGYLQDVLAQSLLVAPQVGALRPAAVTPAAPRLVLPPVDGAHLRLGAAALRLDPVSGEGTPAAVQSAILAAAVMSRAAAPGAAQHYLQRLLHTFRVHLEGCLRFYAEAFRYSPAWQGELAEIRLAHQALTHGFAELLARPFAYRLDKGVLQPIA